ncbi:hypothetical protein Pmar_PMAR018957 [Perkinsus marinus ATCC 50983]|uniref:Uncharacterized protein n=1 Tax=Perkinsus marinus (strain ATCC 50983 / TXsc) TaxID=423536 RepID=C5KPM1_PERM5|nr:hypothetical protein Pmar_PMAR018957 [Perkinsus marinus ATCC 50983]EER13572.1 hypothetical protein Pmar_PMAR018957 [Perkinsus marinus ATCC 50983]|eukprot:XP_002781777.1 hypothetical protein Pmar_PMAR018957 [Perkinsus marinus ATCC 50983]
MATPEELAELSEARRELAATRRSLRDTREALNNIISDEKDDTQQLMSDLASKEASNLSKIGSLEARIAELEALADRSVSEISRKEGFSRLSPRSEEEEHEVYTTPKSRSSRCPAATVTKLCLPHSVKQQISNRTIMLLNTPSLKQEPLSITSKDIC